MADWPQLRRIARALFPELDDTDISDLLRRYHHGTVVACDGTQVIGYYQIQPRSEPGVAWLNYLGVLPAWRCRGAATALLDACERHGKHCGFESLALDVLKDNVRARRFYERRGYVAQPSRTPADAGKIRFGKRLAQAPALARTMPHPRPATPLTMAWRKLAYALLMRLPGTATPETPATPGLGAPSNRPEAPQRRA